MPIHETKLTAIHTMQTACFLSMGGYVPLPTISDLCICTPDGSACAAAVHAKPDVANPKILRDHQPKSHCQNAWFVRHLGCILVLCKRSCSKPITPKGRGQKATTPMSSRTGVPPPPLVQAMVNDQKLMEPTPSVA